MLRKRLLAFGFTALVSLAAVAAHADITPADSARIDKAIHVAITASSTPSAQVAVVKDGKVVYNKAFGNARLLPAVTATPATRYQIASVSKEFLAAAVLLLQEDGKMSLDDHVSKWFPELTSADKITVRQLLTHTSGYSDFWAQDYVMAPMTKNTTPLAIAKQYATVPLDYQPGDAWQYSNTGYVVAGLIVEKVSGQPMFDFVRDRILKPVGINDAVDISAETLTVPDALGYQRVALANNSLAPNDGKGWFYGAAFLGLTAEDVAKWDLSVLKHSLLKPESYALQTQTVKLNNGRDSGYAMGLFISKDNGHTLIEHSGEGAGYISENRIYPDDGLAIVVLTNSMSGSAASDIADRIAFTFMPGQGADAHMQAVFEGLQAGKVNRDDFTENFNGYLSAAAVADYQKSLGILGTPASFKLTRTGDRGGMQFRGYRIRCGAKTLNLSVYVTKDGKIEQFLVTQVS